MTAAELIAAIERQTEHAGRKNGKHTRLLCPAHDDHHPSLDVAEGDDGRPLVVCRSHGCTYEEVLEALGLEARGGPDDRDDWTPRGPAVARYRYVDERGELLFEVCRTADKQFLQRRPDPTAKSGWRWKLDGTRRVLYRLPEVLEAVAAGKAIWITEGEKHADLLRGRGRVATTNPMGAGKWRSEYADALAGAARVFVLADDDTRGREHADEVARSLRGRVGELKVVELFTRDETKRDVVDFYAAAHEPEEADRALVNIVENTRFYTPRLEPAENAEPQRPFALPLDEFIAQRSDAPPILIGTPDEVILPRAGFLQLVGRGGRGKTTSTVDAAFHLASGVPWLEFPVERPLRILFIENEGPQEMFRAKLEAKRELWPHEISGTIYIYTESWGAFTLADAEALERLRRFIEQHAIDLVIGDPLNTLGATGVGSPEDTQAFVALLAAAGLGRDVAFWLLHHPRKERTDDELDEASGAWGGKPDAMLRIDVLPGDRARLSFPKVRWSRRSRRPALILAFDPSTESYTVVGEETEQRDLRAEIEELLADGKWRTKKEISASKEPKADDIEPGIGANEDAVGDVLEGNPERFESRTGEEALAVGRKSKRAFVWQLRQPSDAVDAVPASSGTAGGDCATASASIGGSSGRRSTADRRALRQSPDADALDEDEVEQLAHDVQPELGA